VVAEVLPGGLAADASLRPGDVIQEVNRRSVRSARNFARSVEQARGAGRFRACDRVGNTAYVCLSVAGDSCPPSGLHCAEHIDLNRALIRARVLLL
jgi:S1-C subfamily serine protease